MRSGSRLAFLLAASLLVTAVSVPRAQVAKSTGAATPQDAVATFQKAAAAGQLLQALSVVSPDGVKQFANEGVSGVLMVLAFSDPDDPMPGAKPTKAELDSKRKQYRAAVDLATRTLKAYGLDTMIGKPALAPETQQALNAALDKADNLALVGALFDVLPKMAPLLGMKEAPKPQPPIKLGTIGAYKIDGDRATARNDANTLEFVRINGRWYIEPPAEPGAGGPGASGGSTAASAPATAAPPAPRATASGKAPEIAVGGVQIVRVAAPADDFMAKPFRKDNGTTIALWVKMPAGQGLIEIDDDESVLLNVGDDKGSSLGGKFGNFPDEFKDGTGGIIEIVSTGFPAAGATAINAEGSVAMRVATGTRKSRVAKVQLQNDAKFTFNKTPIIVSEVQAQDESQTFTLRLPRSVMEEIKNVVFLDAKGQPIEGSRTGSGYMNDAAEMGFSVKTTAKMLTLEFESWTGLRTVKVPFKVKAGLGLD